MRLCTGTLLPKHFNNYVTDLKTAPQLQKQRDCDLMTGKPLKSHPGRGIVFALGLTRDEKICMAVPSTHS